MKIGSITYQLFLRSTSSKKKGVYSITCKLIFQDKIRVLSSGILIPREAWIPENYSVQSEFELQSNLLEVWKNKLHKKLLDIYIKDEPVNLDTLISCFSIRKREDSPLNKGFMEVFMLFNDKASMQIGRDYNKATVAKFQVIRNAFRDFIMLQYKLKDIPIEELKLKHLLEYEEYAIKVLKHKTPTVNKSIQKLKQVIKYAVGHDFLQKDPWLLHKSKAVHYEIVYLTKTQLEVLLNATLLTEKLDRVRDCFIFSCFTGLAYAELSVIDESSISSRNGVTWIMMKRQKTNKKLFIPMLPPAIKIWEKYSGKLPVSSNQKYNQYLKELDQELNIGVHLTTHIARKTFTSTVLLGNNIPLKVASTLLGHSDTKITEKHYAEISNDLLDQHVDSLMNLYK